MAPEDTDDADAKTRERDSSADKKRRTEDVHEHELPDREHHPIAPLSASAIANGTGRGQEEAERLSKRLIREENQVRAVVVCYDIRESTNLMLNLEDFNGYAIALAQWAATVKYTTTQAGGWFDKFTGDGVLAFWEVVDLNSSAYARVLNSVRSVCHTFMESMYTTVSHRAGSLPAGFGLAVGVDYGRVTLSDLSPPKGFTFHFHRSGTHEDVDLGLKPVTTSVTALGRPVVGAQRLSSAGLAYEILAGPQFAVPLEHDPRRIPPGFDIDRLVVDLKAPFGRQVTYRIRSQSVDRNLRRYFPHLADDRGAGDQRLLVPEPMPHRTH